MALSVPEMTTRSSVRDTSTISEHYATDLNKVAGPVFRRCPSCGAARAPPPQRLLLRYGLAPAPEVAAQWTPRIKISARLENRAVTAVGRLNIQEDSRGVRMKKKGDWGLLYHRSYDQTLRSSNSNCKHYLNRLARRRRKGFLLCHNFPPFPRLSQHRRPPQQNCFIGNSSR